MERIFDVLEINNSILRETKTLLDEDISNNISNGYHKTLESIKKEEDLINKKLSSLKLDRKSYLTAYNIVTTIYPYLLADIIDDLIYEEGTSLLVKKTINMMRDSVINNLSNGLVLTENIDFLKETFDDSYMEIEKAYHIKNFVQNDLFKVFYDEINSLISEETDKETKELLQIAKYKFLYINSNFNLLENDSEYLSSNFLSNFNHIPNRLFNDIKDNFLENIAIKRLASLSTYDDDDLENPDYKTDIILSLGLIKSCLTLLSDNAIESLLEYYEEHIREADSTTSEISDRIYTLFMDPQANKKRYKTLSLEL